MHRTALARTHRPRKFAELIAQEHVAATLRAGIEGGRVAHAYLFCGPRGVGKTTAARLLAMALNCEARDGGEPCGSCASCSRIWAGQASLDVVEIDAASHRGVDDARDLRERAMYAPSDEDRYKVYIVDEAHMLTREAWNALLKILEEPPPRVIFVFATTEPQRIRQTAAPVLSRCQRFDFRRVPVAAIVARLREVVDSEGVSAEEPALLAIARRAEGGVRDGLSLLDQVLSLGGDVSAAEVRRMLGLVGEERYHEFFGIIARRDRAAVFPFVRSLLDDGHDATEFVRGLAESLRTLLVLRADPESDAVELLAESRERFGETAKRFEELDLLRLLVAVTDFEALGGLRRSGQTRVQLEVLLLRLVSMDSTLELEELLRAVGGAPPDSTPAGKGSPAARDAAAQASPRGAADEPPPADVPPPEGDVQASADEKRPPAGRDRRGDQHAGVTLRDVWREALGSAGQLQGGQMVALRGAKPKRFADGVLVLEVPGGLREDLEALLADGRAADSLRAELARRLDTAPADLAIRLEDNGSSTRMTADATRQQRVEEMVARDPGLREAVEKLDLTLKE